MAKNKIEYKKTKTVLGDNWHVVVDGEWMFYPFSDNLEELKNFVKIFENEIFEKRYSGENYGLGYYICGYDGNAQTRLVNKWSERGVHVF